MVLGIFRNIKHRGTTLDPWHHEAPGALLAIALVAPDHWSGPKEILQTFKMKFQTFKPKNPVRQIVLSASRDSYGSGEK